MAISEQDQEVDQIREALREYQNEHPRAEISVRRQNPVAIRIRILDLSFAGVDRVDREPSVWRILDRLPDEILQNVSMLLLTPDEAKQSLANLEFENPLPSAL